MRKSRYTWNEIVFNIFNYGGMILICILILYPVLYVLARSVMTEGEKALRPFALIPKVFDFSAYKLILSSNSLVISAYKITVLKTVIGTFFNLTFTSTFAYVLSRKQYPLRLIFTFLMTFTMWFSGGLIPTYLLLRSLGFVNSFWVYILPGVVSAWFTLIMRNFFAELPDSLVESAEIDGANDIQILYKIILPLSKASLATIGLFYAVGHWNSWFESMLYMNNSNQWTLQYVLRQIINSASAQDILQYSTSLDSVPPTQAVRMAAIVVSTVPILAIYPFIQKYFVKGVLVGSIKG